jgi:DNA-directed RNA polymerase
VTPTPVSSQEVRESVARREGADRFRHEVQEAIRAGEASRVGAAHSILRRLIEPTAEAFRVLVLDAEATGGARHEAIRWVKLAGPEVAAYLTAKAALDLVGQKVTMVASRAAEYLADEVRYRAFEAKDTRRFNVVMGKFKTRSTLHKKRVLNEMSKRSGVDLVEDLRTDPSRRLRVGVKLLDVLATATGMFEVRHVKSGTGFRKQVRTQAYWELTAKDQSWLERRNELLQFLDPVYRPMVEPPLDWAPGQRGGYRYGLKDAIPLVRGTSAETLAKLEKSETMPDVFAALNAVQGTPWAINADVLGFYQALIAGASFAGFYEHPHDELPKPHDIDTNEEARATWRKATGKLKTENHLRQLRRVYFQRLVHDAEGLTAGPLWFVFNLDFRGRLYPVTTYLSPQGADEGKALLSFHTPKPLGPEGESYLALHGANMLGQLPSGPKVATLTLEERTAWVREHTPEIRQAAIDPFGNTWWRSAEEPMQFLAFCFEWNRLEEWVEQGHEAETFSSSLPVAQDGSCNGIQHFAAMMRDPRTGATVNLMPSARPNDLYQAVADEVLNRLEAERATNPWAVVWLESGLVGRKLCKRPTMTYGYGSRRYGFGEQLREYVRTHERWPELSSRFVVNNQGLTVACQYLSGIIWDTLQVKAEAAAVAMDWMRTSVRAVVKNNSPVRWTVPGTGFTVEQAYRKNRTRRVKTVLNGQIFVPVVTEVDSPKLDAHKQQNAIAPNVVHSIDAACLMATVLDAQAHGVRSFGMIHDSYATVAGDAAQLARSTREVFVRYYETFDVLELLYQHWLLLSGEALDLYPPPPPAKGTLDLRGVLASDFFFS